PLPPPGPQTLVTAVRVVDATTIAVDLGPRFSSFRSTSQQVETAARLAIDLVAQAEATPPPTPPPPPPPDIPLAFGQASSAIHTIAIDPGHGGDDDGVRSAGGLKEKDLALAVARRAKAAIETRLGLRVLLTRDDDRNVPLDERTSMANNNKADLFIGLHANASMRPSTSGLTVLCAAFG